MEKVILFGASNLAMVAHFYLTHDSPYEVVAFTVDRNYLRKKVFLGLPVVPFEEVESIYPSSEYKMFAHLSFRDVNKFRAKKFEQGKEKGYQFISYVSSKAITWHDLVIGENSMICEAVVINPYAKIGNNVMITPGSLVGHHSVIQDHCFLAAQTVILGNVTVEPYCVFGANSTVKDGITIKRECIIGAGSYISESTRKKGVYIGKPAELMSRSSDQLSKLLSWSEDVKQKKSNSF